MTRKDYQLIASVFKSLPPRGGSYDAAAFKLATLMADALAQANPAFDRAKFYRACGHESYAAFLERP